MHMYGVDGVYNINGVYMYFAPCLITEYNSIFAYTGNEKFFVSGPLEQGELTHIFEMLE